MTSSTNIPSPRVAAVLLIAAPILLIVSAAIVVPAGITLNPADPAGTLAAVRDAVGLHLLELGFDVLGWLALTAGGILLCSPAMTGGKSPLLVAGGMLAAAGLAGLLHDAGNLAVTQLAADADDPVVAAVARSTMLTAKWAVNLAGLLWVAATGIAAVAPIARPLRIFGILAAASGLAAVALPWTTGTSPLDPGLEQLGYLLTLPVMVWWIVYAITLRKQTPIQDSRIRL